MNNPVAKFKSMLLEAEYTDAHKRLMNKSYWGDSGDAVLNAIRIVEEIIDEYPVNADTHFESWLDQVIKAVEEKYEHFQNHAYDPDGYGCGTLSSCIRRMYEIRTAYLEIQTEEQR